MNTTNKTREKVTFLLRLETVNNESVTRRLRMALKVLWRQFDLRARSVEEEKSS
jgi:hypothetical protein